MRSEGTEGRQAVRPMEPEKVFKLITRMESGEAIVIRDDQQDFSAIRDAARRRRRGKRRISLVDSGRFSVFELEWLGEAGVDVYSSDAARSAVAEIELIRKACDRGGAITAYFIYGAIGLEEKHRTISLSGLKRMGRSGVYLHISNSEQKRDFTELVELAASCRLGGSRLVYYHHGAPDSALLPLAGEGAWVHLADEKIDEKRDALLLKTLVEDASKKGTTTILHVEKGMSPGLLQDLFRAGGFILVKTPAGDRRAVLRLFQQRMKERTLDYRAYYLYTTVMP